MKWAGLLAHFPRLYEAERQHQERLRFLFWHPFAPDGQVVSIYPPAIATAPIMPGSITAAEPDLESAVERVLEAGRRWEKAMGDVADAFGVAAEALSQLADMVAEYDLEEE